MKLSEALRREKIGISISFNDLTNVLAFRECHIITAHDRSCTDQLAQCANASLYLVTTILRLQVPVKKQSIPRQYG